MQDIQFINPQISNIPSHKPTKKYLVIRSPEKPLQSLNSMKIHRTWLNKFFIHLSPERMEIENLERDKMLGFNTKFQTITQQKGFVKVQDSFSQNDKFNEVDFSFMGYISLSSFKWDSSQFSNSPIRNENLTNFLL